MEFIEILLVPYFVDFVGTPIQAFNGHSINKLTSSANYGTQSLFITY